MIEETMRKTAEEHKKKIAAKRVARRAAKIAAREEARRRKRITKYIVTYTGKHKHLTLSGIGKLIPGKSFEVTEKVAEALKPIAHYKVEKEYVYVNIKK